MIPTYGKIPTVFQRSLEGRKTLIPYAWPDPTVEALKDFDWEWTEKIDGANVRVHWDGYGVSFLGRHEGSEIPPFLLSRLQEVFSEDGAEQVFEQMFSSNPVTLFCEGYGHKIGGAGDGYLPDRVDLMVLDVMISGNYQTRTSVSQIASAFGLCSVPIVGHGTLLEAIDFVRAHPTSRICAQPMEGLVCRPRMDLRDRSGNRVIVKVKWKDVRPDRLAL